MISQLVSEARFANRDSVCCEIHAPVQQHRSQSLANREMQRPLRPLPCSNPTNSRSEVVVLVGEEGLDVGEDVVEARGLDARQGASGAEESGGGGLQRLGERW